MSKDFYTDFTDLLGEKNKMKQILLINPYIYDFAAYDFWIKPLGLLYLSTILKNSGFNTVLIDCLDRIEYFDKKEFASKKCHSGKFYKIEVNKPEPLKFMDRKFYRYGIPVEFFKKKLIELYPKPDIICITCQMTYWYYGANETIKIIKEIFPEIPIVFGGTYASIWPAHCSKNIKADYFIYGLGENKLIELLSSIFDLNIKSNAPLETLIKYNVPDYSLYGAMISAAIMTSRGCKFNCAYCASKKLFDRYISFPLDLTIETIDYLVNVKKVSDIAFYDDALLEDSENHFIPLLKKILERKYNCRFHLPNAIHIKYITNEIAELMKQTGFDTIRLGFESSDTKWLSDSGFKYKSYDFENAIKSFERAGFDFSNIAAYILVGLPEQTKQNLDETISYVKKYSVKLDYAFYSPLPYTKYWEKSVELFPRISEEPLLTNSSVFPVLTGMFFDRRKTQ